MCTNERNKVCRLRPSIFHFCDTSGSSETKQHAFFRDAIDYPSPSISLTTRPSLSKLGHHRQMHFRRHYTRRRGHMQNCSSAVFV